MANRDVDHFNRWAGTYDRHWMQRRIFMPVQEAVIALAAQQVAHPAAILDVGCGTGRLLRAAEARFPGARLVGVDPAPEMVRNAQASLDPASRITFQQGTAEELPFSDDQFDLVFSTLTFHHWRDQGRGIAEVGRVLAPGGRWLLADFVPAGLMKYFRRLFRIKRFRERAELDAMLAASSLAVVAQAPVRGLRGQVKALAIG